MRFNSQQLLFGQTPLVSRFRQTQIAVPEQFYARGYAVLEGIDTREEALGVLQALVANVDARRLPLLAHFLPAMRLAKADAIPVCADIVASTYQVLHFDMGQPMLAAQPQPLYLVTGLYAPPDRPPGTARTRILPLHGLLTGPRWGAPAEVRSRIRQYVAQHGDGWAAVNTNRLACFARLLDAASGTTDLADARDRTVGQWFGDGADNDPQRNLEQEYAFFAARGIRLSELERHVRLRPGQLLVLDNTRVVHGRMGKRRVKEIYQFMLGVEHASAADVGRLVDAIISLLTRQPGTGG
jgi:hypothetical protein